MMEHIDRIEKLIYTCFKEISDHTFQDEVISPHIKIINESLKKMTEQIEQIRESEPPYSMQDTKTVHPQNTNRGYAQREYKTSEEREDILKLAYALSRFDHFMINEILKSSYKQTEIFNYLSKKMKVKANTLKNYRDLFDPHVNQERSNRKGWYQKELSPEFIIIKQAWDDLDYEQIKYEISKIIEYYK